VPIGPPAGFGRQEAASAQALAVFLRLKKAKQGCFPFVTVQSNVRELSTIQLAANSTESVEGAPAFTQRRFDIALAKLDRLTYTTKENTMPVSNLNAAGNEITSLFSQAESMLDEARSTGGERAAELKKQGMQLMADGIAKAKDLEKVARQSAKALASSTDNLIHENPWRAIAISSAVAAGAGVALGVLLARK
jgi:ElaB/YqjD/DUF883 family membrane-anchored ribosome-binding protein